MTSATFTRTGLKAAAAAVTVAATVTAAATLAMAGTASASTGAASAGHGYNFTTLNNKKDLTFNQLLGINSAGKIAGYFGSGMPGHPNKGYTVTLPYRQRDYKNENFPAQRKLR